MAFGPRNPGITANLEGITIQGPWVFKKYIKGTSGDDVVVGTKFAEDVDLGAGDDRFYGSHGANDTIDGGYGDDTIYTGGATSYVIGGEGDDVIMSSGGNDTIDAGADDDYVIALDGDDLIDGGSGNDTLDGWFGNDTMTGGTGFDVFEFMQGAGDDVITDYEAGVDTIRITIDPGQDANISIQGTNAGIVIGYGSQGDTILLAGVTQFNPLDLDIIA